MPDRTYTYEIMFLIGQSQSADLSAVIEHIHDIFGRSGIEVLAMRKWDERRLAYEIKKQKRGLYILAYVKAPAKNMPAFERDTNLSEKILRVMVLRADHLTLEEMQAFDAREDLQAEAKLRAARAQDQRDDEAEAVGAVADGEAGDEIDEEEE